MAYHTLPEGSRRFVFAPSGGVRMTCECCEFPTLPLVPDVATTEVDWALTLLACPLCDWESGPALEDGTPDPAMEADRNDGCALADAKANFERYSWMYDPADPPEWMGGAPTVEEMELRRSLREAYEDLSRTAEWRERGDAWQHVLDVDAQLRAVQDVRRAALEESLAEEDVWEEEEDDDEDDPTDA